MKVTFHAQDPRRKARPLLDEILEHGTDQVSIACPFLTAGGAKVMDRHAARLGLRNSFLVVVWEEPTTHFIPELEQLHHRFPGHLYLHLGSQTPFEKGLGRG